MGLNAAVYRKISELPQEIQGHVRLVDPMSGEIEYADPDFEDRHPSRFFFAVNIFLGNISMISWVSERLREIFPGDRPMLEEFLRGGSQSGSIIPPDRLPEIEAELADIENKKNLLDEDVRKFIESVACLVSEAKNHSNAIVFL